MWKSFRILSDREKSGRILQRNVSGLPQVKLINVKEQELLDSQRKTLTIWGKGIYIEDRALLLLADATKQDSD